MNLADAYDRYLNHLTNRQLSEAHIRTVKYRLGRFLKETINGNDTPLADRAIKSITKTELSAYFIALRVGKADGSMAGHTATHRAFWKWCKKKGWIKKNPAKALRSYSNDPHIRKAAPESDVLKVIASLSAYIAHRHNRPRDIRDALLVSLSVDCGGRLRAMCGILRATAEKALSEPRRAQNGRLVYTVTVNQGKTGAVDCGFGQETADLMRMWLPLMPTSAKFIFCSLETGDQLLTSSASRAFERICKFAAVPVFRSHAVRKRDVTQIWKTIDSHTAQAFAGHADPETTRKHYKDADDAEVSNAIAQLAELRRGPDEAQEMAKLFGLP